MTQKNIYTKRNSFTLIETLVSVSIFAIVVTLVIAVLVISVSSKSKVKAYNDVRQEGAKIMFEIQNMVESGNAVLTTCPTCFGFGITNTAGTILAPSVCTVINGNGVYSRYKDSSNNDYTQKIYYNGTNIVISKKINALAEVADNLNSNKIQIVSFTVSGLPGNNTCTTTSPYAVVSLQFRGKTSGSTGDNTDIYLRSTFIPKYPNPKNAGDSTL